jgi:hypothetical protein
MQHKQLSWLEWRTFPNPAPSARIVLTGGHAVLPRPRAAAGVARVQPRGGRVGGWLRDGRAVQLPPPVPGQH